MLEQLVLDLLGLLLTIAVASFGLWAGLLAGMLSAFVAAWSVRKSWGKAIGNLMG